MGKNTLKRSLIVGIVFLFLSTACLPVHASEGKPDLMIEGLGIESSNLPYEYDVFCVVKNIGSENANDFIDVKVEIKRVFFGVFLINKTLRSFFANCLSSGGLPPNETTNIEFAGDYQLPAWGFYRIYCQVNPDKRIEETDYNNNFYTQDVLVLFGDWVKVL